MRLRRFALAGLCVLATLVAVPATPAQAAWYGTVTRTYWDDSVLRRQPIGVTITVNRHDNPLLHYCEALIRFTDHSGRGFRVQMSSGALKLLDDGAVRRQAGAFDTRTSGTVSHSTSWYDAGGLNGGMRSTGSFRLTFFNGVSRTYSLGSNTTYVDCG
jgi:hypothetical protein